MASRPSRRSEVRGYNVRVDAHSDGWSWTGLRAWLPLVIFLLGLFAQSIYFTYQGATWAAGQDRKIEKSTTDSERRGDVLVKALELEKAAREREDAAIRAEVATGFAQMRTERGELYAKKEDVAALHSKVDEANKKLAELTGYLQAQNQQKK